MNQTSHQPPTAPAPSAAAAGHSLFVHGEYGRQWSKKGGRVGGGLPEGEAWHRSVRILELTLNSFEGEHAF
jgi:hypothetical protein